jgi:hypothetical protein
MKVDEVRSSTEWFCRIYIVIASQKVQVTAKIPLSFEVMILQITRYYKGNDKAHGEHCPPKHCYSEAAHGQ